MLNIVETTYVGVGKVEQWKEVRVILLCLQNKITLMQDLLVLSVTDVERLATVPLNVLNGR